MKFATTSGAQGDVLFRRVSAIPKGAVPVKRKGPIVVAHSETGHNHVIEDAHVAQFDVPENPLVCYLQLTDGCEELGGVDVSHLRSWDTHETVRLLGQPAEVWEARRQREGTPEGWRRVDD
jgi:hypothetical protein